jgi:organic radical activating enzyme
LILQSIINHSNVLKIEYMLGNTCNFRCSYCFPGSNEGNKSWPKYDIAIKNFKHLISKYNKPVLVYFVGGEVTLWKDFPRFCREIKKEFDVTITLSTNGSRKLPWWKRNIDCVDVVHVSLHHEYSNIKQIKQLMDFLYESCKESNVDVLMDPREFNKCVNIVEELKKESKPWTIIAKIVLFNGLSNYTTEQEKYFNNMYKRIPSMDWYKKAKKMEPGSITVATDSEQIQIHNDSWFALHGVNKFKGWKCNLGVDILKIEANGTMHGNCGEFLYGEKFKYNLYDKNFIKNFNPNIKSVICTKNLCPCSGEAGTTKWKINAKF